jgi:hypothetical protein
MPRVGFETMIPVFQRAKTVYVLGRADTVVGYSTRRVDIYINTFINIRELNMT